MSEDASGGAPSEPERHWMRSGTVPQANDIVRPRDHSARGLGSPRLGTTGLGLLGGSVVGLAVVGLTGPNLARPDLGPRGWAPGALPWTLGPTAVTLVLAAAHLAGVGGVLLALRSRVEVRLPAVLVGALALLGLLVAPFGSADHVNYAAYGRVLLGGGDPFTQSPVDWAGGTDPVTSRVEAPWQQTPSVYGPVATAAHGISALAGGDNLRQVVWVWQLVLVLAWLATRVLLRRLASDDETRRRVDLLWTLNPLVYGVGLLGAHVDVLAVALAVATLLVGVGPARLAWLAGVLLALTASTKLTYATVGAGLLWAWWRLDRPRLGRRLVAAVPAFAVVLALVHLPFGAHVYDQVGEARRSISLATPWRPVYELLRGPLGGSTTRSVIFALAAVLMVVLAALLLRLTRGLAGRGLVGEATRMTFALSTAYVLLAPYSLPWYDLLTWALLPLLAASLLDTALLGRGVVMAIAYVPGRVLGLELTWPARMLWWRKVIGPIAAFATLLGLVAGAVSGGRGARRGSPRSPATPR